MDIEMTSTSDTETVIYGVNAISTLVEHEPHRVLRILYAHRGAKGFKGAREVLIQLATTAGIDVASVRERHIEHYAPDTQHQGVLAFIRTRSFISWKDLCQPNTHPLLLALDQVTDPRNFGAILRSAEAFGISGVLITSNRCARPGPTAARTSAGMSELIPIAIETNLSNSLRSAQSRGYEIIGTALDGNPATQVDWNKPTVIVIGAEGKGLREKTRTHCDQLITIPMLGRAESLNAAVAGGIIFYEATRHRLI